MRSEDNIELDGGPRVNRMYRLMVEYIAEHDGIPMSKVYQQALEALIADYDWKKADLTDYYGRRADDLDIAMHEMKLRGINARRHGKKGNSGGLKAA